MPAQIPSIKCGINEEIKDSKSDLQYGGISLRDCNTDQPALGQKKTQFRGFKRLTLVKVIGFSLVALAKWWGSL